MARAEDFAAKRAEVLALDKLVVGMQAIANAILGAIKQRRQVAEGATQ